MVALAKAKPKTLNGLIRWDEKHKQPFWDKEILTKESVQQFLKIQGLWKKDDSG